MGLTKISGHTLYFFWVMCGHQSVGWVEQMRQLLCTGYGILTWMARQGFQALSLLSISSLALTKNGKGGEWRLFSMLTPWSIQMMDLIFSLRNFYEGLCHSPPLPKSTTLIKLSREFGSSISPLILFQIYCSDINLICYIICSGSWTHFLFFKYTQFIWFFRFGF